MASSFSPQKASILALRLTQGGTVCSPTSTTSHHRGKTSPKSMEGKDTSLSNGKSPLPQAEAQPQNNETNGGVLTILVKEEAAQAISKTKEKKPKQQSVVAKKRGALHLLRVALFMLRRGPGKKSKSVQVEVASKGFWRKVVGSMRPLHLHDQQPQEETPPPPPPPPAAPASAPAVLHTSISIENFQEMLSSTMSPQRPYSPSSSPASSSSAYSSIDGMSRYASAQSLQELGRRAGCYCDDDIEEEILEDGDERIDAKAEEFISNFYEQMRLQRLDSIKCHNEMIKSGPPDNYL